MFWTLLQNKYTWIVLGILICISLGWTAYNNYQTMKFERNVALQNAAAYEDSLHKTRDSVQTMTAFVYNLNDKQNMTQEELDRAKSQYRALKAKYDILVDSIKILGRPTPAICTTDTAKVPFSGKSGIITYNGETVLSLRDCKATYSLSLSYDPIFVESELYLDEKDNLWKMRTISKTEGVKLLGISTVDNETFKKISGLKQIEKHNDSFGVGAIIGVNYIDAGIVVKPSSWMYGLNYRIADKSNYDTNSWMNNLSFGITYFIF